MAGLPGKTVALGNPQSSIHQISQVELADWMMEIEGLAGLSGFAFVRGSAAALSGLGADGNYALVVTTAAERGIYLRASGSWSKVADLPLIMTESLAADQAEADRILAQAAAASANSDAGAAAGSAAAAASSQSLADVARTQAQLAAVAAGATIYASVAAGEAGTVNGDVFLVTTEPGVQVYENDTGTGTFLGWLGEVLLDDAAALDAWNPPSYPATGLVVRLRQESVPVEVLASGATDQDWTNANGIKLKVHGYVADATAFGGASAGAIGVDSNPMLGGWGKFSQVTLPTRPAWDPIDGPNPTASGNDLEMAGHSIDSGVNSAVILGGRPSYYSWVGDDASLSCTYGGDNINTHIAGMNFGMHSDLVQGLGTDGVTEKGDHGAIFGGSYHRVSGSYSISAGGQIKDVFGLQCGAFAGLNIKIGSLANVDAVRRSVTAGGYLNEITTAFQSAIIGGERNTWTAGDNGAIIGGDNNEVDNTEHGFVASSQLSKVTADRASVISSTFAVADVPNAITRSVGRDTAAGDSQTHHIEARRTSIGPNIVLSVTGADGVDLFTPPANTRGVVELLVTCQRKSTSIVNGAEYMIRFSYSNLGGTLSILGQTLDVIFENDAAWNCVASVVGSGTRLGVTVQTNGSTATFCATATGRIVMQTISD